VWRDRSLGVYGGKAVDVSTGLGGATSRIWGPESVFQMLFCAGESVCTDGYESEYPRAESSGGTKFGFRILVCAAGSGVRADGSESEYAKFGFRILVCAAGSGVRADGSESEYARKASTLGPRRLLLRRHHIRPNANNAATTTPHTLPTTTATGKWDAAAEDVLPSVIVWFELSCPTALLGVVVIWTVGVKTVGCPLPLDPSPLATELAVDALGACVIDPVTLGPIGTGLDFDAPLCVIPPLGSVICVMVEIPSSKLKFRKISVKHQSKDLLTYTSQSRK
jgi:hypothetical protein